MEGLASEATTMTPFPDPFDLDVPEPGAGRVVLHDTPWVLRGTQVVDAQIQSWTGENQVELNIAHLERGYYLVQLAMGDLRMTHRLIIQ